MMLIRLIRKQIALVGMALLVLTGFGMTGDAQAWWYKGPWMIYEDTNNIHILVETETCIDNDIKHRKLEFTDSGGCTMPNSNDISYYHHDSYISGGKDRRLFKMVVSNLEPNCHYKYKFSYRATWLDAWHSKNGSFYIPPTWPSHQMDFVAFGDQRCFDNNCGFYQAIYAVAHEVSLDSPGTFILNTGDIVYYGGYQLSTHDYWKKYFKVDPMRDLLSSLPMMTTPGNHDLDYGHGYDNVDAWEYTGYFPYTIRTHNAREVHYARTYGPFRIYSLSSYPMDADEFCSSANANFRKKEDGGTGQYEWLEDRLKGSYEGWPQWKIVMLHTPLYDPDGGCNNQHDARNYLKPLFEKYGVDLVLAGHEHFYARKTVNGISYFILGGGGAPLGLSEHSPCRDKPKNCESNGEVFDYVTNKYHYVFFRANGDVMTAWTNDHNGDVIEKFTIDKTPKADFDISPEKGAMPLSVTFTDTSTGNGYKYEWDFGDGTKSDLLNGWDASIEHTYMEEGKYTVTLTVWSAFGSDTKTCNGCVSVGPIVDFEAMPLEGPTPLTVTFEDKCEGYVDSLLWDFGDGNTSTDLNPTHTYDGVNGRRTVKLTAWGHGGASETKIRRKYIKLEPYALYDYKMDRECVDWDYLRRRCVDWDYSTTFTNLSQGKDLTYHWDFGDGHTSTETNPSHTYSHSGASARLTVTDTAGVTDYITKYIEQGIGMPLPPEAAISIDIMPKSDANVIEITKHGHTRPEIIPVAILSDASFDATSLDQDTITFGRTGSEASLKNCERARDVNGDGYTDLLCRFDGKHSGFQPGDSEGILRGLTITDRRLLEGRDYVQVISQ